MIYDHAVMLKTVLVIAQVARAQTAAAGLVFVAGTNALCCCSNLPRAARLLGGELVAGVVREDEVGAVAY